MTPQSNARVPKYRLHKTWGLGVVRINGKDIYLGKYGTPESHAEYRRLVAEWLSSGGLVVQGVASTPDSTHGIFSVNELVLSYLRFAKTYYVKNGRPTGEVRNLKDAVRPLVASHGQVSVTDFGPLSLKAVRESMIASDLSRGVVNERVNRIRRVFKWGVENQIVPPSVLHGLQSVAPLKRGRCNVRETDRVVPVPDHYVDSVINVAPKQIAAMIQLQRLTGMRPGEVVIMRTCDIDMSGPIWEYRPFEHKTEHHGRTRVIYLGPQSQEILGEHLKPELEAFLFSPKEVKALRAQIARANRVTPMTPSQLARRPKASPRRAPTDRYNTVTYARAISYACDKAFPHPEFGGTPISRLTPKQRVELADWKREHRWSPNRLRHNAATYLRKRFGIEAARVDRSDRVSRRSAVPQRQDLGTRVLSADQVARSSQTTPRYHKRQCAAQVIYWTLEQEKRSCRTINNPGRCIRDE